MMMMSRFVERITNGPQTRCRSAEQVGLQMSSGAAGKLFQVTGPAIAKLLIPSVVLVLGTDSVPVPAVPVHSTLLFIMWSVVSTLLTCLKMLMMVSMMWVMMMMFWLHAGWLFFMPFRGVYVYAASMEIYCWASASTCIELSTRTVNFYYSLLQHYSYLVSF